MKNKSGITLIALIITIIVMLILVAVTVNVAMNGGLFGKASEASKQTQIEADKEALLSCVVGAIGTNGKLIFSDFKSLAEREGFTVDGVGFPCTATSKNQNIFTVTADGKIIPPDGDEYLALLQKYFVGKAINSLITTDGSSGGSEDSESSESSDSLNYHSFYFKDGTGDAQEVKGSDISVVYLADGDNSDSMMYAYIKYAKNNKYYKVTMTWTGESNGSSESGNETYDTSSANEDTYDTSDDISSSDSMSMDGLIAISVEPYNGDLNFGSSSISSDYSGNYSDDSSTSSSGDLSNISIGDFDYTINGSSATLLGINSSGANKLSNGIELTPSDEITYQGEKYTVTTIGSHAFENRSNLVLTNLPSGLISIEYSAFYGCESLALESLPDSLTSIGDSAFYGCPSLALSSLPDSLTSIGDSAFYKCSSLALSSLPDSVTSIGENAFYGCTGITQLDISKHPNKETLLNSSNYPWGFDKDQLKID